MLPKVPGQAARRFAGFWGHKSRVWKGAHNGLNITDLQAENRSVWSLERASKTCSWVSGTHAKPSWGSREWLEHWGGTWVKRNWAA